MKTNTTRLYAVCVVAMLAGAVGLQSSPGNEVVSSINSGTSRILTNLTFGYSFTVGSQGLSVSALGIYDPSPGNGLAFSHDVGLWDSSGSPNPIAMVTIPSGTVASLSASGFWYEGLSSSVPLLAGGTYTLGAKYNVDDTDLAFVLAGITSDPAISLGDALFAPADSALTKPTILMTSFNAGYFGPNAQFSVVPEPTACGLLCLGLLALAGSRWNREGCSGRSLSGPAHEPR
jgi:hypothetical protein